MRNLFKIPLTAFLIALVAQPAYADKFVYYNGNDRDWRERRNERHHYRHGHDHDRRHNNRKVIVYRPSPYIERTYISNRYYGPTPVAYYNQPATYSEIRCTNEYNPLGLLIGGAAGGILGHQFGNGKGKTAATIGGAVLGGALGSGMTQQRCSEQVFEQASVGMPISWVDARNDQYYAVTPTREYRTAGRYCREYQARAVVGGRTQDTYGTACMQPDGSWEVIN